MRRAFVGAASGAAGVALLAFACDSFEAAPAPAPDASSEAAPDAVPSDAPTSDGGNADAGGFCDTFTSDAGETLYCRDFDDGRDVLEGWNQTSIGPPGVAIETDTTFFVSPPGSFMGRLEPDAGGGCGYARAIRDVAALRVLTRVAFDVRIGGAGTKPADGASYFVFDTGSCLMIFSAIPTRGDVHIQGTAFDTYPAMIDHFPRVGEWTHVEMTIRAPTNRLEVTVDGQPALDNGGVTLPQECITPASRAIIMPGLFCEPVSASSREVRIDNLVVTGTKL